MDSEDVDRVIGIGRVQRVGSFQFTLRDQRWRWSDEVAAMHGYAPGTVTPTTELLLAHKHPDDRPKVAVTLANTIQRGEPFCSRHRIVDTGGHIHHVLVVGDRTVDERGELLGTSGFYIDVTDSVDEPDETDAGHGGADVVADVYESRAVIEQAKGALMLVYGIDADQAFDVLTWRSQVTNVKLRVLARRLIADCADAVTAPSGLRSVFDHLLLTVHERVVPDTDAP